MIYDVKGERDVVFCRSHFRQISDLTFFLFLFLFLSFLHSAGFRFFCFLSIVISFSSSMRASLPNYCYLFYSNFVAPLSILIFFLVLVLLVFLLSGTFRLLFNLLRPTTSASGYRAAFLCSLHKFIQISLKNYSTFHKIGKKCVFSHSKRPDMKLRSRIIRHFIKLIKKLTKMIFFALNVRAWNFGQELIDILWNYLKIKKKCVFVASKIGYRITTI